MALVLTITAAGRAALVNAQNTGTAPVTIAQVGVSAQAIAPTTATAALPSEIKRIGTLSGDVVAEDTIHLIVRDETSDLYTIRSFALYLADGTLFAAYGQTDPIMEKSAQSLLLLAIDVRFVDIAAPDLTFGGATFLNPPATVDRQGVVELATDAEATDGTDSVRVVTPRGAKAAVTAWLNSRFGDGAPSAFMKGLLLSASAVAFRASLAIKSAALKDEGAGNGLDADLLDGQHGAWYADIPARLGYTPWHLNNDGAGSGLDADLLDGQEGSYYLPAATYTAADALTKLKSVDGAGSGLDADLLDGKEGAAYALLAGAAFTGNVSSTGASHTFTRPGGDVTLTIGCSDTTAGAGGVLAFNGAAANIAQVRGNFAGGRGLLTFRAHNGSSIVDLATLNSTGLNVIGAISASGAMSGLSFTATGAAPAGSGPSLAQFISGGIAWLSAHDYTTQAGMPLSLAGSSIRQRVGNVDITTASPTGLTVIGSLNVSANTAVSGYAEAAGLRSTGNTFPATGQGVEHGFFGTYAFSQGYSRSTAKYVDYRLSGLTVQLAPSGVIVATVSPGGLAVTGTIGATADISTTGALIASGAVVAGGLVDAQTPNIATTGGVRIRGNQTSGMAYLQFTDATAAAQWGYFSCNATGLLTWGGNTLWHAGNDGSGSGLDADLLDGQHGNWWRDWLNLLNKPASFPPSAHYHLAADLAGAFTGSMTQNGWVVLPNGLIIQWGRFSASPNTTTRVSFPMTFPSAGFAVSPNAGASGGADSSDNPPVLLGTTIDQVGFTVFSADDVTCNGAYIAIGY